MGSISKRPVAPPVQQSTPVLPVSTPVVAPTVSTTTSAQEAEAARVEERESSLLRRNRGFLGTVLTGFQGVLNDSEKAPRKTLLGE